MYPKTCREQGNLTLFFALGFCVTWGRVDEVGNSSKKNERFLGAGLSSMTGETGDPSRTISLKAPTVSAHCFAAAFFR
jgi:hypothetical protein